MGVYSYVLGPMLLSVFLNTYATGAVGFQYAAYLGAGFDDPWPIKSVVAGLCIIDVFQVFAAIYMIWAYCVQNYLNPLAMDSYALWTYAAIQLCNALSGVIAHGFLTCKIYDITKGKIITGCIAVLTCVTFGLGIANGVHCLVRKLSMIDAMEKVGPTFPLLVVWLGVQLVLDKSIAATLGRHVFENQKSILAHLPTRLSKVFDAMLQSHSAASLFSLCSFISFLAAHHTPTYIVFLLPTGRLYSASVLNTLIARDGVKSAATLGTNVTSSNTNWASAQGRVGRRTRARSINLIQIKTEQEVVVDGEVQFDIEKGSPLAGLQGEQDDHMAVFSVGDDPSQEKRRSM